MAHLTEANEPNPELQLPPELLQLCRNIEAAGERIEELRAEKIEDICK